MTFKAILSTPGGNGGPAAEPVIENKDENRQFGNEELQREWLAMCQRMPQQMAGMSMRMKNMMPVISTFPEVEVVVDNQILLEQMAAIKGRIKATLAKALHNGNITLSMRVAEATELKKVLSRKELFEEMRTRNQSVEKLSKLLKLELT